MHEIARFGLNAATRYATAMLTQMLTSEDTQTRTALPYASRTGKKAPRQKHAGSLGGCSLAVTCRISVKCAQLQAV